MAEAPEKLARRILLVEDNIAAAATLQMILELSGFDVDTARNGREALERARSRVPDVVICDIGLPEMDGFAVAEALRDGNATRSARLIALTGHGGEEIREKVLSAGFEAHLVKPVNPDTLLAAIDG